MKNLDELIIKLGTKSGTLVSILVIASMGFAAGVCTNNYIKNIEILELKKENFIEIQDLNTQLQILKLENKDQLLKLANDGEKEKK